MLVCPTNQTTATHNPAVANCRSNFLIGCLPFTGLLPTPGCGISPCERERPRWLNPVTSGASPRRPGHTSATLREGELPCRGEGGLPGTAPPRAGQHEHPGWGRTVLPALSGRGMPRFGWLHVGLLQRV